MDLSPLPKGSQFGTLRIIVPRTSGAAFHAIEIFMRAGSAIRTRAVGGGLAKNAILITLRESFIIIYNSDRISCLGCLLI